MRKMWVAVLTLLLVQQAAFAVVQRVVISAPRPGDVRALAADGRLDVLKVSRGRDVECFADDTIVAEYRSLGYTVTVKLADAPAYYRRLMAQMRGGKYAFGPYYTYPVANQKMDSLHLLYPSLVAAKESLGVTRLGKKIYGFSLTAAAAGKPGVLFTGQHHAREPFGCNNAIEFARYLCQHYGSDSLVTFLVNNRQFWFIPIVNVDGSIYNSDTSADGMWRKNRRNNGDGSYGVDLNRNYPYKWGCDNVGSSPTTSDDTYRGPSAGSEPETQAEMNLMNAKGYFRTALNYHTYSNLWVLPWAWSDSYPVDSAAMVDLTVEATSYNGYAWGTPSQTVGYTVNGDANDWAYETADKPWKCLAMTPEVGGTDFYEPDSVQLELAANLMPNLLVSAAAGVYLEARGHQVSGGNGDAALDPGETANLAATLKNEAVFDTARNVSAVLSSADPYVSIGTAAAAFGDFNNRQGKSNAGSPFVVTLGGGCPVGHSTLFSMRITADGGYASSDTFSVIAGVGDLHYQPTPDNSAGSPLYYAVEDSDAAARKPTYQWTEIRGTGTVLNSLLADDATAAVTLPFTFRWYGTGYTTLSACSNGWISFGSNASTAYGNTALPTAAFATPTVFALWDDMDARTSTATNCWVGYYNDAANHRFIVEYDSIVFYGTSTRLKFQVIYYDSTASNPHYDVVLQYAICNPGASSSVGFQQNSTTGAQLCCNGAYPNTMLTLASGRAIRLTRDPNLGLGGGPAAGPVRPQTCTLGEIYPNPSSGRATISYQLPQAAPVGLRVYNVSGQLVRTLVQGTRPAGTSIAVWDGRDAAGLQVSSGVYLFRLETPDYSRTGKLSMVR